VQRFQRYDDHGWFKVGQVEVTTSVFLAGTTVLSIFLWVVRKSMFVYPLTMNGHLVRGGEIWRVVTWPLVNGPSIWVVLTVAMLYLVGNDIERELGRRRFAWLLGAMTVVPGLVGTLYPVGVDFPVREIAFVTEVFGANTLVSGLFVVLVLWRPTARWFFEIPLWIVVVVFEVIYALQVIDQGDWPGFVFWLSGLAVAALLARAFGLTEFTQIPKLPLPQFVTGDPYTKANRAREKSQRKQAKGSRPSSGSPLRRSSKEPAPVIPIRPEARLDRTEQADMDALLDKISATGVDSLTPDERRRLDEHSRRLRGQ